MVEKLFEYLGEKTPFSLFCSIGDFMLKVDEIEIEDIEYVGERIRIYFNTEDYLLLKPDDYVAEESCDTKFVKRNGDYILFIDEVEPC